LFFCCYVDKKFFLLWSSFILSSLKINFLKVIFTFHFCFDRYYSGEVSLILFANCTKWCPFFKRYQKSNANFKFLFFYYLVAFTNKMTYLLSARKHRWLIYFALYVATLVYGEESSVENLISRTLFLYNYWIQILVNVKNFIGMVATGFINSSLTTIENKFHLSSTITGFISGSSNIGALITILPISFLAGRWIN